jgi:hypothetical protein
VRLDHLLSKEHLQRAYGSVARATTQASVLRWSAQGWNIDDWSPERRRRDQYGLFGGLEAPVSGSRATCTLLGPEGSAPGLLGAFASDFGEPRERGSGVPTVC